ncbi:MAG TPA: HAMP domain-containing sensor histidine kinase [Bryobacteraceae bacterium]|jgi:signal transduction histidine kinase
MSKRSNPDPALPGLLHDLNNIFQTLVDAADLLSEDPKWQPISAAILRSVERGRLVTLSLQAARSPRVPFQAILDNAIAFVEDAMLAARGPAIRFICDVEPGIELPGNWTWERVLINLFLNSMRAMPQGGEIQVQARFSSGSIVVRDCGCGIPPEILDRLFEPGVSTKAARKSAAGLGLQVVESIVRQDGGSIRAANRTDGPGAEFTITLPAAANSRPAHA